MKAFVLSVTLLVFCAVASAQTWQPTVNMNTTGYSDSWNRTVVRTKSNVVYYVMNHSAISSGSSQVRVYKGNAATPTSFTEMDTAHEPTDSSRIIGVDARLNDTTGIISIAYQLTSPLQARYITFDTATDTFGAVETISSVNHAPALRYLSKVSLALDPNGVPHATFGGDNEGLFYSNRIGGTWSAKFSLSSNVNDMHPSLTFGTDGVLHLAWLGVDSPRRIFYRERATNGTWSATETVDGAVGTVGDKVDQSPSIALSIANLPLILYHEQSDTNANVIIKQRNGVNSYSDVSPTPVNTARGHDWAITVDWAGNWTICGHGNPNVSPIEPQCMTRNNATGTWSGLTTLINDGTTHDGSASLRYDAVWPGDQSHLDLAYFDENNTPDSFYMSANITGPTNGGGTPAAALSTSSLTFADQIVGTTSAGQNVSVTNTGGGSLTITSITAPSGFAETDNCTTALSLSASCQISITFSPTAASSFSGSLTITDNTDDSPHVVTLSGTGTTQQALSISGTITPAASGSGVTLKLTGTSTATVTANASGNFTFNNLANGSYTVTPTQTGETFNPASRAVTINGNSVAGVNFTAIPNAVGETIFTTQSPTVVGASDGSSANYELGVAFTSAVSGSITAIRFWKDARETGTHTGRLWAANGQLLATAVFSGESASGWQQANLPVPVSIAANTQYVASVNTGRTYFVVTQGGLTAKVTNQDLSTVVGNNGLYGTMGQFPAGSFQHSNYFRDVVFTPNSNLFSASGNVLPVTSGAGTTLTLSGAANATIVADATGNYTFNNLPNGTYSVAPNKTSFSFAPPSLPFTLNGSNATALNFTATALTGSISGTITPITGGAGATVSLSGAASATVTSDGNGVYSFPSLPYGTYTVTPSEAGFTFAPASRTVTISTTTVITLDFVASEVVTTPILNISPLARTFGATQGATDPPAAPLTISNTGGGTLNYTVSSDQPWLTASPVSGTAPQTISVRASVAGVVAGTYTGHLIITANGAQGSPGILTVTFVVVPPVVIPPALSVTPSGLTFTSTQGGTNPAAQTINVSNTGGGSLGFTVASDQSWLVASPASGSAPQAISVSVTNAGLTSGTYTGHVIITAPGVQGSPASINTTFTVTPASSGALLLGTQTVLGNRDSNALGQAEAFQTTAVSSGTLTSLSLYLDSTNTAGRITVGLYTDNAGHPGTLLTQATSTVITAGNWNTMTVPPTSITTGVKYWIAILASGSGSFRFRDNSSASCGNEGSAQTNLITLPAVWTRGPIWRNCPVSGYGK